MLGKTTNNNRCIENRTRPSKMASPPPRRRRWKNNPNNLAGYNTYDVEFDEKNMMRFILGTGIVTMLVGIVMTCVSHGVTDSPFSTKFIGPLLIVSGILFIGLNRIINFNLNYDNEFLQRSRECGAKPNAPQIQRTTALEPGFQRIPEDDPEIGIVQDTAGEGTNIMGATGGCTISAIDTTADEGTSTRYATAGEGTNIRYATAGEGTNTMGVPGGCRISTVDETAGEGTSTMYAATFEETSKMGSTRREEVSTMEETGRGGTSTMNTTVSIGTFIMNATGRDRTRIMEASDGDGSCNLQMMELQLFTSIPDVGLDGNHTDEELASLCSSDITVYQTRV